MARAKRQGRSAERPATGQYDARPRGAMPDPPRVRLAPDADRAQRARAQHVPNIERSIAAAVVVKDGDLFFLADRHGDVPMSGGHGYGLFYHDCRYLSGYSLHIGTEPLIPLSAVNRRGFMAVFRLTNRDTALPDGTELAKQTVGIEWTRLLRAEENALRDVLVFRNYGGKTLKLPVEMRLRADFDDIFEVRSLAPESRGKQHPPRWDGQMLEFCYDGEDRIMRKLQVRFSVPTCRCLGTTATFEIELAPQEAVEIGVELQVIEHDGSLTVPHKPPRGALEPLRREAHEASEAWVASHTSVRSNSISLDRVLGQCLVNLYTLRSGMDHHRYFAAGVPWYGTLFGRDSLITAYQMLAFDPTIASQTLWLLAELQGQVMDVWREEEPGKILHELRRGELANLGFVPFGRYYGSVDATPLFLILLAEHARWTGSLALFEELHVHLEAALHWIEEWGDRDHDGYLEYNGTKSAGLLNQGWKDSDDAVTNADGTLARPPIALVEVQGYVYRAYLGIAELFERACDGTRAEKLRQAARRLRRRFQRDFWMPDERFYAMGLQSNGRKVDSITSNAGQALWTGIVSRRHAGSVARRLLAPDMFSGWGIRTLSTASPRYNPLGYHLGTVWPHDNALIMEGFRRYGLDAQALQLFLGMFDAATMFPQHDLPELFSGYARETPDAPVSYPVACHPQAWSAGALPFMLASLLGLQPDGFANVLRVERPVLPPFVDRLELHGLRVGRGHVGLRFARTLGGVGVSVLERAGGVEVVVVPGPEPAGASDARRFDIV